MNKVPTVDGDWDTAPYEAQYLRLIDVTEPLEVDIDSIEVSGSDVLVSFASTPGYYYNLEVSMDDLDGSWTTVVANEQAEATTMTLKHSEDAGQEASFYRVRVSYVEL